MMKPSELVKKIFDLSGPKVILLFGLTVPLGLLEGVTEIFFGFTLLNFLSHFQLVTSQHMPLESLFSRFNPVVLVLMMGLLRSSIAGAALVVNTTTQDACHVVLRKKMVLQLLRNTNTF